MLLTLSANRNMIQLSAVIITFNEEQNIARCLQSLQGVADEVVVVDSFSKDQTVALCNSFGAKVYSHAFEGHIQQKNYALTKASYDHVLSLDADEALDDSLKSEIIAIKGRFIMEGYYLNRLTNYCGHWVRFCGWYPDRKLRLFDRRKGSWTGTNPHDRYALHEGDDRSARLRGNILHYSYYTLQDHYRQIEYFTNIAAEELYRSNRKQAAAVYRVASPLMKFFKMYVFQLGFLDGWRGLQICALSSYAAWLKYHKLILLRKKKVL